MGGKELFPVLGGGTAKHFAEAADEITEIFEAGTEADFHNGKICFPQQTGSIFCPQKIDVLHGCPPEILTEKRAEILGGETKLCRNLRLGEMFMKMLLQIGDDGAQHLQAIIGGLAGVPFQKPETGAERDDMEQLRFHKKLIAGDFMPVGITGRQEQFPYFGRDLMRGRKMLRKDGFLLV